MVWNWTRRILYGAFIALIVQFSLPVLAAEYPPKGYDLATAAEDPAHDAAAVTPSDTADLSFFPTALWVGVGGTVIVVMAQQCQSGMTAAQANAVAVTFIGVPTGSWLPLRVCRVMQNTTAQSIVAVRR